MSMTPPTWLTDISQGFATFGVGVRALSTKPNLYRIGLWPALVSSLVLVGGFAALAWGAGDLVTWATPFADTWMAWSRQMLRGFLEVVVMVAGAVLVVLAFTSVTLTIGAPFYERISAHMDRDRGRIFSEDRRGPVGLVRAAVVDTVANMGYSMWAMIPVFLVGLIPVLGQIISPFISIIVGSWLACLSLCQPACERRGLLRLRDRRTLLGSRRARVIGFGLPAYLLCLIPVAGVFVYPWAIAGATILVDDIERDLRGWPRV